MSFFTLLHAVGSMSFFSSRAFLTAFATAALMRWGGDLPFLGSAELLEGVTGAPHWFTSDMALLVLGVLAGIEVLANKSPEARELLQEIDRYLKPGVAGLTTIGMIGATDAEFIQKTVEQAGFGEYFLTFLVVPGVYLLSVARGAVLGLLSESDEDDDIGIQNLISWAEDVGVVGGLVFLVLFPVVMVILLAVVSGLLLLAKKRAVARDEKSKVACSSCGEMIYPVAMACYKCHAAVAAPRAVGVFGQVKDQPAVDLATQPYRLVEKKRCSVCATRLKENTVDQACPVCGHRPLGDAGFAGAYVDHISARLPLVLAVSFVLSLIPVVGLIPGVIYYRTTLIAPFRRYVPLGKRIVLKWAVRVLFIFLIAVQWVPMLGGFVVPAMALVNYGAYRGAFRGQLADG